MQYKSQYLLASILTVTLLLVIAGCVISPRRTFTGTPAPTPTPTDTPVPTATPTPTPTAGSAAVSTADAQFVFVGDSTGISGFKINQDGSLLPMLGSAFHTNAPVTSVVAVNSQLIAASGNSIGAFAVNKGTGAMQQTDSIKVDAVQSLEVNSGGSAVTAITQKGSVVFAISGGKLQPASAAAGVSVIESGAAPRSTPAALDSTGKFMYVIDAGKAEIAAYRVDQGKPEPLTPPTYPISRTTDSLAVVKP
jgi:6-phosphogluconolactonase (cycloisomerase 2 family)